MTPQISPLLIFQWCLSIDLQYLLSWNTILQVSTNSTTASSYLQLSHSYFRSQPRLLLFNRQMISLSSRVSISSSSIIFQRQQTKRASSLSRLFSNSPFSSFCLAASMFSMALRMPVAQRMGMLVSMLMRASSSKLSSFSQSLVASMKLLRGLIFLLEARCLIRSWLACSSDYCCIFFHLASWYKFSKCMLAAREWLFINFITKSQPQQMSDYIRQLQG